VTTKAKILIVGDEGIVAEDLMQTLVELGYEVPAIVYSGHGVLEETCRYMPDLLLADISLAGGSAGIAAVDDACSCFDIPMINLSFYSDADTLSRSTATDPFAFLLKPFDPVRLRHAIEIALAKHIALQRLRENGSSYHRLFEVSGGAMLVVAEDGTITMVNEEFERLSGCARQDVENKKVWTDFFFDEQSATCGGKQKNGAQKSHTLFIGKERRTSHVYLKVKKIDNSQRRIMSMVDISEFKRSEEEIRKLNDELIRGNADLKREIAECRNYEIQLLHQAHHDSLTGLPNRELFFDRLSQALAFEDRHKNLLALMILDLDNFKAINDTKGHVAGDSLLKEVAKRLQACMRTYDTVARFGGDEFVILVNDMPEVHDVVRFVEKVLDLFQQPFSILGQPTCVTASIGVSIYPLQSSNAEELLKMADTAMYLAKREGKKAYRFFTESMALKLDECAFLKKRLHAALDGEEFLPHYQPRIDAITGRITGMEVLLRWQPTDAPLVYPADFFPILEECGLIIPVGEWLFDKVCRQTKAWQEAGLPPLRVGVNVSDRQFRQDDFLEKIVQALSATRLDPRYLEIELPEQIIMDNVVEGIGKLKELKKIGVKISLDNFGLGYSSLLHLSRLPIDELQIDRSLINCITASAVDANLVSAIISMGHSLGKMVVAEGIESEGQYRFLAQRECQAMQGHYFSKPLPSQDFEKLVRH
jgi:diguanylate cyclase (GGDEF)-like protein/PAS domain S-box-containing protein